MSAPRAIATLVIALVVSAALSVSIQAGFAQDGDEPEARPGIGVDWAFRPGDLGELVTETPAVVVAKVEAIRAGAPIGQAPAEIPTQRVDMSVTNTLDGQVPQHFTLFKIGSADVAPSGDPSYTVGDRHLLFVRPRLNDDFSQPNPDGTYLAVAPDGRLEKLPSGELDAVLEGPVAEELDGLTVAEADQAISHTEGSQ
jgi:hypothetical protein